MANEPLALAIRPPEAPKEDEYLTLCAALSQSARGRAFLAEHTRRSRNADNEALLTAIGRIETRLQADAAAVQRLRDDLRMLVTAIRLARPEIDAADPPARAVKLAKLLDLFERRIDAMAEARASELPADAAPRARIALAETEPRAPSSSCCRCATNPKRRYPRQQASHRRSNPRRPARPSRRRLQFLRSRRHRKPSSQKAYYPRHYRRSGRAASRSARSADGAERRRAAGAVYVMLPSLSPCGRGCRANASERGG